MISLSEATRTRQEPSLSRQDKDEKIKRLKAGSFHPFDQEVIKQWVSYPGMAKLIHLVRDIESLVQDVQLQTPAGMTDLLQTSTSHRDLYKQIVDLSHKTQVIAASMACSQAGPIAVSAVIKTTHLAQEIVNQAGIDSIFMSDNYNHMLQWVSDILSTARSIWPKRQSSRLGQLFHTIENYTAWSKVTNGYLQTQATKECDKFISKSTLAKIGTKSTAFGLHGTDCII
jgi:hypothetical protein